MPELVPLDGGRSRRGIAAKSDAEPRIQCCITVAKGPAFDIDKTRRKRKASTLEEASIPELSDEIVVQILVRLPVKSLLHCKAVCKAWRAIVKDPWFVSAHLRWSAVRWEQEPSFLLTPVTLDRAIPSEEVKEGGWPITFSNQIRFYNYKWLLQQSASDSSNGHGQQQTARFMHAKDLVAKSSRVGFFAHCDGLVLAPTQEKLYLCNPATGETVTLPKSHRNKHLPNAPGTCHCVGLGLDPRTGKYKVFQAFYRTYDTLPGIDGDYSVDGISMGMEVFTVCGGGDNEDSKQAWSLTEEEPLCLLQRWQTGVTVKRFIFWFIDTVQKFEPVPWGLARIDLADEHFDVIPLPWSLHPAVCDDFTLDALQGQAQLCITARTSDVSITIWTMLVDDDGMRHGRWEPRYSIPSFGLPHRHCRLIALVPGGSRMLLWSYFVLHEYDLATSKLSTVCEMDRMRFQGRRRMGRWKNLWSFYFVPYTESLLRINAA